MEDPAPRSSSTPAAALGAIVSAGAVPYGYTITLWCSGALLIHYRGQPNVGQIFLFAAGGLAGFAALGWLSRRVLSEGPEIGAGPDRALAGTLHWFSAGVAIGAVALIAHIHSWVDWPLASFTATTIYLLVSSLQLAAVVSRH